jgi:hypothetical protein
MLHEGVAFVEHKRRPRRRSSNAARSCFGFGDRGALALRRAVGDRRGEAATLSNMGINYALVGDLQKALDSQIEALSLQRVFGDIPSGADSQRRLAGSDNDLPCVTIWLSLY